MFKQGKYLKESITRRIFIARLATLGVGLAVGNSSCASPSSSTQPTTVLIYKGHTQAVNALTWSPDSKHIASSGGYDETIQVWNATTGQHILTYHSSDSYKQPNAVAWSPNGKYIASSNESVQVWNMPSGDITFTYNTIGMSIPHELATYAVAWSSDNQYLAFGGMGLYSDASNPGELRFDSETQIWDVSHKRMILFRQDHPDVAWTGRVTSIAWSPDNKRIASANSSQIVEVWDSSNGANILTLSGRSNPVTSVVWSPDGKFLATGGYDATVQIWNAATGKHVLTYSGHPYAVYAVAWSPDSKYIASGSYDKTVQVWAATMGKRIFTFKGHSSYVYAVAWSPDGKHIASGGQDKTVQVWQPS